MTRDEFNHLMGLIQDIEEGITATKDNRMDERATVLFSLSTPTVGKFRIVNFPLDWMYRVKRKTLQGLTDNWIIAWPSLQNGANLKKFVCDMCGLGIFCVEIDYTLRNKGELFRHEVAFFSEEDAIVASGLLENYDLARTIS